MVRQTSSLGVLALFLAFATIGAHGKQSLLSVHSSRQSLVKRTGDVEGTNNFATVGAQRPATCTRTTSHVCAAASTTAGAYEGTSDLLTSIFNLAKTILGSGVLALPAGIAAFSDNAVTGLVPATGLLIFMAFMSAYSFASIGRACRIHDVRTFSEAWAKSVGPKYKVVISSVITFKTFFACLAYSIIIGDSFSSIMRSFGVPPTLASPNNVILALTSLVIFPLCMLRNMDALKYTSVLGLGGISYCALFIAKRFFDGSYRTGGQFYTDIAQNFKPSFNKRLPGSTPSYVIFVLISMMSSAFSAHYNAPKFWIDLKNKTPARYNTVIAAAFGFSAVTYMLVMWTGFLTFGGNSVGFILNNYSSRDIFATFARLAVGLAILFGYPLTFSALREGVFDLLKLPAVGDARSKASVPVTISILALITSLSLVLKNLGVVVALSGALIGAMLIYFTPACLNIYNIKAAAISAAAKGKGVSKGKSAALVYTKAQQVELLANYGMAFAGVTIAIIGVFTTLVGQSAGH